MLAVPYEAEAQPADGVAGVIEGRVMDEAIGQPLAGVNVFVEGGQQGAATGADGRFHIDDVPAGEHTVVASLVGFRTERQQVQVRAGETVKLAFELEEKPVEINELVVERTTLTGGRSRLDEVPGSAHYITPRELERQGYRDIHRVLQSVPGVYVQEEDGYGLRPNIGLRGTGVQRSSKITVMEDGVLAAPAPYAAPAAYYFPTVGRMHGVEVRKGSSQIKYGPFTTGGALNLLSTPIPSEFSGQLHVLAGEQAERTLHANVGHSYEHVGFLAEAHQARTNGFKHLQGGGDTGFDKRDYLAKLRLSTGPEARVYQSLTLKAGQTEETSNETYLGLTQSDFEASPYRRYAASQRDVMNTEQRQFQLRHFIQPARFLDVTTTAYRNTFERNWYKLDRVRASSDGPQVSISSLLANPEDYADEMAVVRGASRPGENALELKNNNRSYYAQGIQTVAGLQFGRDGDLQHDLELGLRLHEDQIDRFQWVDVYRMEEGVMRLAEEGTPGTESNRITTAQALAAFAQYRLERGRLALTPGLRYEHIRLTREDYATDTPEGRSRTTDPVETRENTVDVLIPGIGLDYDFTEALRGFAGVHKGFAPPGVTEGARPEESISYEAGLRYRQAPLEGQAVFFLNDYSNLLGRDMAAVGGDPSGETYNGGAARVWGAELTWAQNLGTLTDARLSLPFSLAYTYTRGTFQTSFESDYSPWSEVERGDELPYLPSHQLAASFGLEGWRGFGAELRGRYAGTMRTVSGQGTPSPEARVDGHLVFDASAEYAVTRQARLFLSVRNLTDAVYVAARRPAGLRPGLPRTFQIGIKADF